MTDALTESLSEAEIERLAAQLAANTNPGALNLEAVDGLFCALVASPDLTMPSEYLPLILGGEPASSAPFRDASEAQEAISLLIRYWKAIARDFEHETVHLAYLGEPDRDGVQGRRIFQDEREGF